MKAKFTIKKANGQNANCIKLLDANNIKCNYHINHKTNDFLNNGLLSAKKLTVNPKSSIFSKLKNHIETALTKAKKAIKDIKFAIIAPIFPITLVAPCEIASKMFFASLFIFNTNHYGLKFEKNHMKNLNPLGKFFIEFQSAFVFFVSG